MEMVLQQTGHQEILEASSVLALAQGSPGEAITAFEQLQAIPPELLAQLTKVPKTPPQGFGTCQGN
jgi:DNA polymerase-3 subunit delta'